MGFRNAPGCGCCGCYPCASPPSSLDVVLPAASSYVDCTTPCADLAGTYTIDKTDHPTDTDPRMCYYEGTFSSPSSCFTQDFTIGLELFNDVGSGDKYVRLECWFGNGNSTSTGVEMYNLVDNLVSTGYIGWAESGTPITETATSNVSTWLSDRDCSVELTLTSTEGMAFAYFNGFVTSYKCTWPSGEDFVIT